VYEIAFSGYNVYMEYEALRGCIVSVLDVNHMEIYPRPDGVVKEEEESTRK
jgi:hypothetical protein